jgi:hypothetical protein
MKFNWKTCYAGMLTCSKIAPRYGDEWPPGIPGTRQQGLHKQLDDPGVEADYEGPETRRCKFQAQSKEVEAISANTQAVTALCYMPEGLGFETQ